MTSCVFQDFVIRPFGVADIEAAHSLSSRIGWSQTLADWQWLAGQGQGYAATIDGRLVGVTLYWRFEPEIASIGAVMVDDACRGRGIAGHLFDRCLADLTNRGLILYATEAGKPLYLKRGFEAFETLEMYQGVAAPIDAPRPKPGLGLRPITPEDHSTVAALATQASGINRFAVMRSLLDRSEGLLLLRNGEPRGFALHRPYGQGFAIGPVAADGFDVGHLLIQQCLIDLAGQFIRIDTPADTQSSGWLSACGLLRVGSALGMRQGAIPRPSGTLRRIAVATQATG